MKILDMKIYFYPSEKQREIDLAKAFCWGAVVNGYDAQVRSEFREDDLPGIACMVGVKSKVLWGKCVSSGVVPVMFDKGYSRHKFNGCWEYWRVSYGSHNPSRTLTGIAYNCDRWGKLGIDVTPWRMSGRHILVAGSSEKYHNFHGLDHPNEYYNRLIRKIKKLTSRQIIYRPKPSFKGGIRIKGALYSKDRFMPLKGNLVDCHALVTHGSNSCYESAVAGVPSIVLGDGVMRSESSTDIGDINLPKLGDRLKLFYGLAYHQWTLSEMGSGEMFETFKRWI